MQTKQSFLAKRPSKAIVDILLIVGLILSIVTARTACHSWWSFHCVVSLTWYALMLIHIWQHWQMTKALLYLKWKALKRNKMTFLTLIAFVAMTFSVVIFVVEVNDKLVHVHHHIAHVFWAVIIIHTITKIKQFMTCLR